VVVKDREALHANLRTVDACPPTVSLLGRKALRAAFGGSGDEDHSEIACIERSSKRSTVKGTRASCARDAAVSRQGGPFMRKVHRTLAVAERAADAVTPCPAPLGSTSPLVDDRMIVLGGDDVVSGSSTLGPGEIIEVRG
jgi:hypothetical protein